MIKKANLESLMPTIYTKLKSLGEINDIVPIQNIVSGLSKGDARAYVSNEDKNTDGIPDKIYIVYPKLNIDLQQDLLGVTTADITAFPNLESQKMSQVSNILGAVINVLNHEQDHLRGFKSNNGMDEFSPEHSAEHAGDEAAKKFINKYTSLSINNYSKNNKMINNLKKLSLHLKNIKEESLAKDLDVIISTAEDKTGEDIVSETQSSISWLTDMSEEEINNRSIPSGESELLVVASDTIIEVLPYDDVEHVESVRRALEIVERKREELKEAEREQADRLEKMTKGMGVPEVTVASVSEKKRSLNIEIKKLNKAISEAKDASKANTEFLANLRRHSGSAASASESNDQSFSLDNLFASSIMGPRK